MRRIASAVALGILAAFGVACSNEQNPVAPSANPTNNINGQPQPDQTKGIYWSEQRKPSARTYGVVWSD